MQYRVTPMDSDARRKLAELVKRFDGVHPVEDEGWAVIFDGLDARGIDGALSSVEIQDAVEVEPVAS